jgi:hypothetical protein
MIARLLVGSCQQVLKRHRLHAGPEFHLRQKRRNFSAEPHLQFAAVSPSGGVNRSSAAVAAADEFHNRSVVHGTVDDVAKLVCFVIRHGA